jgi:hypothetical protein
MVNGIVIPQTNLITSTGTAVTSSSVVKKKGKKRKISKHILDAKLKSTTSTTTTTTTTSSDGTSNNSHNVPIVPSITASPSATTKNKKQRTSNQRQVKDPMDVEGYLLSWQKHHHEQQQHQQEQKNTSYENSNGTAKSSNIWKFNKNTQSWLIRHLYDSTKINKSMFTIALEYFQNSNHTNMIQRLQNDAIQRAIQYQEGIKNNSSNSTIDNSNDNSNTKTTDVTDDNNNKTAMDPDNNDEATQQSQQKRKEYKRARKILDTLKEEK